MYWLEAILVLVAAGAYAYVSYRQIEPGQQGVVTRLGKVRTTLEPGPHFVVAGLDRVRIFGTRVLPVQLERQEIMTKDGVQITIQGIAYYRIEDTGKVITNMGRDFDLEIRGLAESNLRQSLGRMDIGEVLKGRAEASEAALKDLNEQVKREEFDWGISFSEIALTTFDIPKSLEDALARSAAATKDAEALDIRSQAEERFADRIANSAAKLDAVGPTAFNLRQLLGQMEMSSNPNAPMMFWAANNGLGQGVDSAAIAAALAPLLKKENPETKTDQEGQ